MKSKYKNRYRFKNIYSLPAYKIIISNLFYFYRMQLEMALHQLHAEMKADELLFWGKITGKYLKKA